MGWQSYSTWAAYNVNDCTHFIVPFTFTVMSDADIFRSRIIFFSKYFSFWCFSRNFSYKYTHLALFVAQHDRECVFPVKFEIYAKNLYIKAPYRRTNFLWQILASPCVRATNFLRQIFMGRIFFDRLYVSTYHIWLIVILSLHVDRKDEQNQSCGKFSMTNAFVQKLTC